MTTRATTTAPSPTTTRRSGLTRNLPKPIPIAASRTTRRVNSTAPSPIIVRRYSSTRNMPTPTTTAATRTTTRPTTTAPSPTIARRSGSTRNMPKPISTAASQTYTLVGCPRRWPIWVNLARSIPNTPTRRSGSTSWRRAAICQASSPKRQSRST